MGMIDLHPAGLDLFFVQGKVMRGEDWP